VLIRQWFEWNGHLFTRWRALKCWWSHILGYWLSGSCRSSANLNRTQNFGHWHCFCPVTESSYSYQAQQRSCCSTSFTCGWKQFPPVQRSIVYGIPKNGRKSRNQMYDRRHEFPTEEVLDMLHNQAYIAGWFHYQIRCK
jgi:hypothetical protein